MPIRFLLATAVSLVFVGCTRAPAQGEPPPPLPAPPVAQESKDAASQSADRPTDALDWDGARWDAGNVVGIERSGDRLIVTFDRYGLYETGGVLREGITLTAEPLVFANTDLPYENRNPKLRRYLLSPTAKLLRLANGRELCTDPMADVPKNPQPRFEPVPLDELLRRSKAGDLSAPGLEDHRQDALTFDPHGRIVRIVFSASC